MCVCEYINICCFFFSLFSFSLSSRIFNFAFHFFFFFFHLVIQTMLKKCLTIIKTSILNAKRKTNSLNIQSNLIKWNNMKRINGKYHSWCFDTCASIIIMLTLLDENGKKQKKRKKQNTQIEKNKNHYLNEFQKQILKFC